MDLSPETLLSAYAQGAFPMTDRDGRTRWYTADPRGIIPLEAFHVPRTLQQLLKKDPPVFDVRFDHDGTGPNPVWPNTIIDLEHVSPTGLTWSQLESGWIAQ